MSKYVWTDEDILTIIASFGEVYVFCDEMENCFFPRVNPMLLLNKLCRKVYKSVWLDTVYTMETRNIVWKIAFKSCVPRPLVHPPYTLVLENKKGEILGHFECLADAMKCCTNELLKIPILSDNMLALKLFPFLSADLIMAHVLFSYPTSFVDLSWDLADMGVAGSVQDFLCGDIFPLLPFFRRMHKADKDFVKFSRIKALHSMGFTVDIIQN